MKHFSIHTLVPMFPRFCICSMGLTIYLKVSSCKILFPTKSGHKGCIDPWNNGDLQQQFNFLNVKFFNIFCLFCGPWNYVSIFALIHNFAGQGLHCSRILWGKEKRLSKVTGKICPATSWSFRSLPALLWSNATFAPANYGAMQTLPREITET